MGSKNISLMIKSKTLYIFSGIEPGKKGAGSFISFFLEKLDEHKIEYILKAFYTPEGFFVKLSKKLKIHHFLKQVFYLLNQKVLRVSRQIKGSNVLLLHPQSIGVSLSTELIKNNKVYFYVFDNFLFCKKSYNYIEGNNACTLCLYNSTAYLEHECDFFPVKYKQSEYDIFLKTISENINNIHFLVQNKNQEQMIVKKFGTNTKITKVGMLIHFEDDEKAVIKKAEKSYDFLYHNTLSFSKGLLYFIKVAELMPNNSFIIPYAKESVEKAINAQINITNIDFLNINWNSGLKEILINCKVVLNPSLWSAPVEGALLKSINYNGCVAVIPTDLSFQEELPNEVVQKLSLNIDESVILLNKLINSSSLRDNLKTESKQWLLNYVSDVNESFNKFIINELK